MKYMRVILTMFEDAEGPEQMSIVCTNCYSTNVSGVITQHDSNWICNDCGNRTVGLASCNALQLYAENKKKAS